MDRGARAVVTGGGGGGGGEEKKEGKKRRNDLYEMTRPIARAIPQSPGRARAPVAVRERAMRTRACRCGRFSPRPLVCLLVFLSRSARTARK